jgi:hypothetical protein
MKWSLTLLGLMAWLATGCLFPKAADAPAQLQPKNVFQLTTELPSTIRRVAILPISCSLPDNGTAQLQDVLESELNRFGRFEIIDVSPEQMTLWTGRPRWRPEAALPADFYQKLASTLDCDAILFPHLAAYQPYKPMVLGWNLKLVEVNTGSIFWAVDELFDASDPEVAKLAARYGRGRDNDMGRLGQDDAVLLSPRRFAQFTLAAVFETLPAR